MLVSYAAEPVGSDAHGNSESRGGFGGDAEPDSSSRPLCHELRRNLLVAGFSLGLSVAVAVGLSLLMTLLG